MKYTDLTFGIPMYNAGKYISELLTCFKDLDNIHYEILLIDDGSTDNSLAIVKRAKIRGLRILEQENRGVSATRNRIIKEAQGKWITFVDADDLIKFEKYAEIFQIIKKNELLEYIINIEDEKKYTKLNIIKENQKKIAYLIETEIINSPCAKFYKKEILQNNNIFFDEKYSLGEDYLFNINYLSKVENVFFTNEKMYIYRIINLNSLTAKYRPDKFEELMSVNHASNVFDEAEIKKAIEYIRIKNCISSLKDEIQENRNKNYLHAYIRKLKKYKSRQYFVLNNLKTTVIYNIWYLFPNSLLIFVVKLFLLKKSNEN